MTHKAVLLVTKLLQNRDLLECSGVAKFREDEEGYVTWVEIPSYQNDNGVMLPAHKIRMYEKPDQKHGVIFRFEFYEGKRPYFTVEDYLRKGSEQIIYLKKTPNLQEPKMDVMIGRIQGTLDDTIKSVTQVGRWLAGA